MRIGNSRKPSQRSSWSLTTGRRSDGHNDKLHVFSLVAVALFMAFANDSVAQLPEPIELEHFQFVKSITLSDPNKVHPDSLLITGI